MKGIVLPLIASTLIFAALGFIGSAQATAVDSDVTTGTTGSLHFGQSFNEIRAVDVTVLSMSDRMTESLTLRGLRPGAPALVGARIYDSATQALITSSDTMIPGGGVVTVTIPISALLVSGQSYRIGFYVQTDPLFQASGDIFVPDNFLDLSSPIPYIENTGVFRINSAHAFPDDSFPAHPNQATPQMTIRSREVTPPRVEIAVSKFFTDSNLDPLPMDQFGNPKVDVVLANGVVRSTNPGQVMVWVNVTNTGSGSFQSIQINETLPMDWTAHPDWLPAKGAIHVFFATNPTSLPPSLEITDPSTITLTSGNPEFVTLSIPDLSATAAGQPLNPGQSILLEVKMDYALAGTSQTASSYPRNYTDTASAAAWTGTSFTGAASSGTFSAFFVAYAKVVGDVDGNFTVDILDAALLAYSYNTTPGNELWNPDADFDYNRVIDILDAAPLALYYGTNS